MRKYSIFLFIFIVIQSFGQTSIFILPLKTETELDGIKKMKVIVQLEQVDEKLKGDAQTIAEKMCADYNALLKELVPKFFTFGVGAPEFMAQSQIKEIKDKENYLILYLATFSPPNTGGGATFSATNVSTAGMLTDREVNWKKVIKNYVTYSSEGKFKNAEPLALELDYLKKGVFFSGNDSYALCSELLEDFPDKAELIQKISAINFYSSKKYEAMHKEIPSSIGMKSEEMLKDTIRTNRLRKENTELLSKKTLLIRQDFLEKSITEGAIDKLYPYDFKIVSKEMLAQLLMEDAEGKYAYISLKKEVSHNKEGGLLPIRNYKVLSVKDQMKMLKGNNESSPYLDEVFFKDLFKS